ncbi:hypothetical protein [Paracoccus hibiscisoli]|uniref:hypothetical protein n=1 Tax=Paracoccus hibiscisoli TaxID=2023261 RepID=UPI0023EF7192|nr:hypothetical protein [Paracoccus hibiscisoli]
MDAGALGGQARAQAGEAALTKAQTKAQRRKRKGTKRDHEEVMEVVHATPAKPVEDPRIVVLSARCRQMGKEDTKANRSILSLQIMGDPSGMAIACGTRDDTEAAKLWQLFRRYDGAHDAHHRRIIGRPRFPNVAKLEYLPERFETREDDQTDTRTPDEKDRDASNRWHRCSWHLYRMARHEREAIMDGMFLRAPLTKGAKCTTAGIAFVHALRVLQDMDDRD